MREETVTKKLTIKTITSFEKAQELFRLVGKVGTFQILTYLSDEARQYKDIDENSNLPKTTLVRRIDSLQQFKIISKNPVIMKGRKTHLYSLTSLGLQLMNFSKRYERLSSMPRGQKKICVEEDCLTNKS